MGQNWCWDLLLTINYINKSTCWLQGNSGTFLTGIYFKTCVYSHILTIYCLLLNFLHVLCICFNQSARYLVDLNSKPLSFLRHCIKEYNCIQKRSVEKRFNDFVFTENICRCTISIELSGLFSLRYIVSVFPFIFAVLDFFLFFQHVRFDSVFLQFPGFVAFSCVVWFCFLWTMCLLPFFFVR